MTRASLLRFHEVRDAYRLIGECRDLAGDPQLWQTRLLEGLRPLLGIRGAAGGEGSCLGPQRSMRVHSAFAAGFDSSEMEGLRRWHREIGTESCPIYLSLKKLPNIYLTCRRSDLVADRDWYRSPSFHCRAGLDFEMTSLRQSDTGPFVTVISVHRSAGENDFSDRQQQLLHFLHDELAPLVGHALVSATEPSPARLSPRLRQTLGCLLEGDSEKQVAARLRLSLPTTHQYVTSLYRHFRVRSRAQLLAHVVRRLSNGSWREISKALAEDVEAGLEEP